MSNMRLQSITELYCETINIRMWLQAPFVPFKSTTL